MTNNQKIAVLCLLPLLFTLLAVLSMPSPASDSNLDTNINPISDSKVAEIVKTKESFYANYAFDIGKSAADNYITFTGLDNNVIASFVSFLNEFNNLRVDFSQVKEDYQELTIPEIYQPVEKLKPEFVTTYIEYAENEEQFQSITEENIKFDYIYENNDAYLSSEDAQVNQLLGDSIRYYYLKINDMAFVNLGGVVSGNINLDKSVSSATVNVNVDKPVKFQAYMQSEKLDLSELETLINNGKGRIYKLSKLGTSYVSEEPDLEEFGFTNQTEIKIESLSIEYFYLEKENLAVPLLKLDGTAEGKDVAFWLWFIK